MQRPASTEQALLRGLRVLVTRPAAQAGALGDAVRSAGGEAFVVPMVEIEAVSHPVGDRATDLADLAIFTSSNAVAGYFDAGGSLAPAASVIAVGPATAAALAARGHPRASVPPGRHESEGVLAMPDLAPDAVEGRQVWIVKGEGGRRLLREALESRGARVRDVEVYRRVRPGPAVGSRLRELLPCVDAVVVTSVEILENLLALAGGSEVLANRLLLVVVSDRIAAQARRQGLDRVVVAQGAGEAAIVAALGKAAR